MGKYFKYTNEYINNKIKLMLIKKGTQKVPFLKNGYLQLI